MDSITVNRTNLFDAFFWFEPSKAATDTVSYILYCSLLYMYTSTLLCNGNSRNDDTNQIYTRI